MAASMRKLRYGQLNWFLRLFKESGGSLSQGFVTRNTVSTSACQLYSKSSTLMAKRWNDMETTHGFAKPRPRTPSKSRWKDSKHKKEEEEVESDPETDDEEEVWESKKKSGKPERFMKLKTQKSAGNINLRPSRYLFKESGVGEEEEENRWERRHASEDKKRKANWYARQMLRLTREDKIDEALELLTAMKEHKLNPTVEVYNIFISAYARSGQVKKAFKLFNDVKKRAMKPTARTFTSLFNACAKAPIPQHALKIVEKLLAEISVRAAKQEVEMNVITYNAAIQALAICGDPLQAFEIYKEMQDNGILPDVFTFSSLLTACSLDKFEGPSMAFQLLEEMKALKIKPDIYIFNAVLKIMRNFKVFAQEQKSHLPKAVQSSDFTGTPTETSSGEHDPRFGLDAEEASSEDNLNTLDSLLQEENKTAKQNDENLKLHHFFPGVEKFIQLMALEDVYPDVRTFNLLLYLTSSKEEESYLMELMKSCNISPDVTFYNTLITKKAKQGDLKKAKVHMKDKQEALNISPSEKSYQVLARGCKGQKQGLALLDEIKSEGITADQTVYGLLIAGAAKQRLFGYLIQLVKRMTKDDVKPNDRMMEALERAYNLPCNKPVIPEKMDQLVVKLKRFRYVEQKGFQTFFENWKAKVHVLEKETAVRETGTSSHTEHYDDDSDDETSDGDVSDDETRNDDGSDDEDSKFSHL